MSHLDTVVVEVLFRNFWRGFHLEGDFPDRRGKDYFFWFYDVYSKALPSLSFFSIAAAVDIHSLDDPILVAERSVLNERQLNQAAFYKPRFFVGDRLCISLSGNFFHLDLGPADYYSRHGDIVSLERL